MKLRSQMLLAGAMTLVVPLVGWQSVKQLYVALQQTRIDEQTLKAANMRIALSESSIVGDWLAAAFEPATLPDWYAEESLFPVFVDGYDDDWKTLVSPRYTYSNDEDTVSVRVATWDQRLYLFVKVKDNSLVYHRVPYLRPDAGEDELPDRWYQLVNGDAVEIAIEQANGYVEHGLIRVEAPGAIGMGLRTLCLSGAAFRTWIL